MYFLSVAGRHGVGKSSPAPFIINNFTTGQYIEIQNNTGSIQVYGPTGNTGILPFSSGTVVGTVPEINPASAPSALALLAGAVLIIRGRRKIPTPMD